MWSLVSAKRPLQDYFGGEPGQHVLEHKTETLTDRFTCNNLANVSVDGNVGSLSPAEPIVYNYGDNDASIRMLPGQTITTGFLPHAIRQIRSWGLGTTYDKTGDSDGVPRSCKATGTAPMVDACMHGDTGYDWSPGRIGSDYVIGSDYLLLDMSTITPSLSVRTRFPFQPLYPRLRLRLFPHCFHRPSNV